MQLKKGDRIIPCELQLLSGDYVDIKDLSEGKRTVLYLMRDFACVLAQLELNLLTKNYEKIKSLDAQALFVIQTSARTAAKSLPVGLPFPVLCNVDGSIYTLYGAQKAESVDTLGDDVTLARIQEAKEAGFIHGNDEGNKLQLPAVIIFDENGIVQYSYYGKTGDDVLQISKVADVLKKTDYKRK